jgi:hypothetical protein
MVLEIKVKHLNNGRSGVVAAVTSKKHLLITLGVTIAFSIAIISISPWIPLFPMLHLWGRVVLSVSLLIGCFGWFFQKQKLLRFGIYGSYLFIWLVVAGSLPDEEYYLFHGLELPSKESVIVLLILMMIVALCLLSCFRLAMDEIKGNGGFKK